MITFTTLWRRLEPSDLCLTDVSAAKGTQQFHSLSCLYHADDKEYCDHHLKLCEGDLSPLTNMSAGKGIQRFH